MRKHVREVLRAAKREFPGIELELLRQRTHYVFDVRWGEVHRRLAVSVTPTNEHFVVPNALKELHKLLDSHAHH